MSRLWILGLWLLSVPTSFLFSEIVFENQKRSKFGQSKSQKKEKQGECTTCCEPERNYRLPADYWGVDTFAEYLFWQMQEQASYFVSKAPPVDNNYPNTLAKGTFRVQSFDWSSGLRVGVGYTFGQTKWQLLGQYTWYNTKGQSALTAAPPVQSNTIPIYNNTPWLQPTITTQPGFPSANGIVKASSSAYFSYQMADLLVTSALLATPQIQFDGSIGPTGGYIQEHWNVQYMAAPNLIVPNNFYWHNQWNFFGGGFRIGINTNWHIGRGFGIFNKLSFAAILGKYMNKSSLTSDGNSGGISYMLENATFRSLMLLPTSQCILGFDWRKTFLNCRVSAIRIALAGEFNDLSNLQQVFKSFLISNPFEAKQTSRDVGSVYMYGATAHFGVDF